MELKQHVLGEHVACDDSRQTIYGQDKLSREQYDKHPMKDLKLLHNTENEKVGMSVRKGWEKT